MKKKLRIAIAGAGMVTRHHLIAWSRLSEVEVVAIYNRNLEKALDRAKEFSIPKAYSDLVEMLEREKPDALDIAVATEAHREFAKAAAEHGVAILCQKPMAPTLKEAEEMVAEIGEKVRFMVHENWRFRPQYRQARKWISEGLTGPVREFRLSTKSSGLVTKTEKGIPFAIERQPFFARMPRFIILELLIHHLDTTRFLVGEMDVISAQTLRVSPDVIGEDVAQIVLKAKNGAIGIVSGNLSAAGFPPLPQDRLELIGERSSLIFDGDTLSLIGERSESVHFSFEDAYQASYNNAIAHFVEALRSGQPFETDRLDNLKTLRLVDEAYRHAGF
ncbi:MAG: Gfo/Idh/MocA family protein [Thermodesulfobacteriota bacterium]